MRTIKSRKLRYFLDAIDKKAIREGIAMNTMKEFGPDFKNGRALVRMNASSARAVAEAKRK